MNILQLKRQLLPMSGPQMGGGGNSGGSTTSNDVAPWARGYAKSNLEKAAAVSEQPYQAYGGNRIAGFDPMQTKAQTDAANMKTDTALNTGISTAESAAAKGLGTTYDNTTFKNQFNAPDKYQNTSFAADQVSAPELQNYQMTGPKDVGAQKFGGQSAQDYMSPYMQNVVDAQQREAQRSADIASTSRGAQAVKSGAFGGSRQALTDAEAGRNLALQKGDIQAAGLNAAYKQAQEQFNTDQARQMQADLANQQTGYNVGAQNLGANLSTQALGSGQKMQAGLANQGANLQAAGMGEQSKQYGYGQGMTAAQLGAQYGLSADQLSEQSKQYGAGLKMQGLNTAISGATAGGNMGNTRFQQGMDINKLQNAYGGQKQGMRQAGFDQEYQDWLDQKNYPYKQVGWMSDMIRGTPTGTVTNRSMYEGSPSMGQNIAAAGTTAYGLSKYMANGGMAYADGGSVPGYAGDNGSVVGEGVDSPDNVAAIVHTLSDADLQKAMQAAQVRGDQDQMEAIQSEMAMRASLKNGIAGGVTDEMVTRMAGGGVLAFAGDEDENDPETGQMVSAGIPNQAALREWLAAQEELKNYKASPAMTKRERAAMDQENFDRFQKFAGEDPYAPMTKRIEGMEADRVKSSEEAKGLAALQAVPAFLQGSNLARGLGAGVGALGGNLAQAAKADAAEKRALASMDFNLKDAQRKERMGLTKDAVSSTEAAAKDRIAADKAALEAIKARAKGATDAGRAFRTSGAGAGAGNKDFLVIGKAYADKFREEHPEWTEAQVQDAAYDKYQKGKASGYQGATEKTDVAAATSKENAWKDMSRKEKKAIAAANDIDTSKPDWLVRAKEIHMGAPAQPKVEPKVTPKPTAQKPAKVSGMPAGATLGKETKNGIEVLDANGKVIGYAK